MPWNLLILPLVGGYYILSKSKIFKYKQQRLDRQRLIFDSVIFGAILLIFTFIFRLLVEFKFPYILGDIKNLIPINEKFIGTSFVSFFIAVTFTELSNFFIDEKKWIIKSIKSIGNELELLLLSSFNDRKLIEFTLDNDKVYIALVKELPIPSFSNFVRVIPFYSGYRSRKKLMKITTNYLPIYLKCIEKGEVTDLNSLDFDLVISINNIVSISYFDLEMYKRFKDVDSNHHTSLVTNT